MEDPIVYEFAHHARYRCPFSPWAAVNQAEPRLAAYLQGLTDEQQVRAASVLDGPAEAFVRAPRLLRTLAIALDAPRLDRGEGAAEFVLTSRYGALHGATLGVDVRRGDAQFIHVPAALRDVPRPAVPSPRVADVLWAWAALGTGGLFTTLLAEPRHRTILLRAPDDTLPAGDGSRRQHQLASALNLADTRCEGGLMIGEARLHDLGGTVTVHLRRDGVVSIPEASALQIGGEARAALNRLHAPSRRHEAVAAWATGAGIRRTDVRRDVARLLLLAGPLRADRSPRGIRLRNEYVHISVVGDRAWLGFVDEGGSSSAASVKLARSLAMPLAAHAAELMT